MTTTESGNSRKSLFRKYYDIAIELIAPIYWLYLISKIFILDVDSFVAHVFFPFLVPILIYKALFFLSIASIILLFIRVRFVRSSVLFIAFYPVIILFWRIPFLIAKRRSWELGFSYLNFLISSFQDFRYNFVSFSIFIISIVLGLVIKNKAALFIDIFIIVLLLAWAYVEKLVQVFQPPRVFEAYKNLFPWWRRAAAKSFELEPDWRGQSVTALSVDLRKQWLSRLDSAVLYNRLCLFVGKKLSQYQRSKLNHFTYIFSLLWLIYSTIFSFAVIFFAIYKIDTKNYNPSIGQDFFDFFYYSFTNFAHGSTALRAVGFFSETAYMVEVAFELFVCLILATLLFSVRSTKYEKQIDDTVADLESQGKSMEEFIRNEFGVPSIAAAIDMLKSAETSSMAFIISMTNGLG